MAEYKENCIFIKDSVLEPYYIKVKLNIFEIYLTHAINDDNHKQHEQGKKNSFHKSGIK